MLHLNPTQCSAERCSAPQCSAERCSAPEWCAECTAGCVAYWSPLPHPAEAQHPGTKATLICLSAAGSPRAPCRSPDTRGSPHVTSVLMAHLPRAVRGHN